MPVSRRRLSDESRRLVLRLMTKGALDSIDVPHSSEEEKAYSTAKSVADATEKRVLKLVNFNELDRDKSGFLENYEYAVQEAFSNVDELKNDWEK